VAMKYQLNELFWEENNTGEKTIHRNKVWRVLDKLDEDIRYICNKDRIKGKKQLLIDKMKPLVKEEAWIEFLQSIEKDEFSEFYIEITHSHADFATWQMNVEL
jgi:hypothetical protein